MKDKIRYSEAFKLKVMEELRDAKWKSVKEAATAYGIAEGLWADKTDGNYGIVELCNYGNEGMWNWLT